MTITAGIRVWWLDGGADRCERCLQRYAYEIEVRCAACDAALCPHCAVVVTETRERVCPGCTAPAGGPAAAARDRAEAGH